MIVVDTSAFVSLATVDTLSAVLEEYDVHTPATVVTELEETADYRDVHGQAATKVLETKSAFTIHTVPEPELVSSRIDHGEASCVRLSRELEADFLLTDDLRALPELQNVTKAQVALSPIMLKALVKRNRLSGGEARDRLETLAEKRDWLGSPIYRRARDLFDE